MITDLAGSEWMCELCGHQASSVQKLEWHLKEEHREFWLAWWSMTDIENGND